MNTKRGYPYDTPLAFGLANSLSLIVAQVHAMTELYGQLMDDKCWLPLLAGGQTFANVGQAQLHTFGCSTMTLMGHLFLRCVQVFDDEWPWSLERVYDGDLNALRQLQGCNQCCFGPTDGYTDALLWYCTSPAEILDHRERCTWEDTVDMCPSSNILVEDMTDAINGS